MITVARKLLIALNAMLKENRPFQDPPFEFMDGDNARGFDVDLMQVIGAELGLTWQLDSGTMVCVKRLAPRRRVCRPGVCFRS